MATPARMATNSPAPSTNSVRITMISIILWAMSGNGRQISGRQAIPVRHRIVLKKAVPIYATNPTAIAIAVQHVPKIPKIVPRVIWDFDVPKTHEIARRGLKAFKT